MARSAPPPEIPGLPPGARPSLEAVLLLHAGRGDDLQVGDLPDDLLLALTRDPPASDGPRIGAALAVMALRDAARSKGGVRWPGRVDPSDPDLRRQGFLLAALATAALVGRTGMGVAASDPESRLLLASSAEDESLAERFRASEEEILRRKGEPVDYPVPDFLADLWEVPERLLRPGRILPPDEPPTAGGPFRIAANHDDRVVRMYDFFRDKYGSPRGERRADLYLAVLSWLSRRREDLEKAGDLMTDERGKFAFRPGYLDVLLRRPPAWFESA